MPPQDAIETLYNGRHLQLLSERRFSELRAHHQSIFQNPQLMVCRFIPAVELYRTVLLSFEPGTGVDIPFLGSAEVNL